MLWVFALVPAGAAASQNDTVVSSRSSGDGPPDSVSSSGGASISGDGRRVAFQSKSNNLVPGDSNLIFQDIFVRDHQTGTTTLISRPPDGIGSASNDCFDPVISSDGRYVTFWSYAGDLHEDDVGANPDVFVRDLTSDTTILVSRSLDGSGGQGGSWMPSISADGSRVVFASGAGDLVEGDQSDGQFGIFVRDLQTNTTRVVSRSSGEGPPNSDAQSRGGPAISGNGRYVAFWSPATNLVPGDTNGKPDIFVRDLQENTNTVVSRSSGSGPPDAHSNPGTEPVAPAISGDGRYVAFRSDASGLVAGDTNGKTDVFLRDLKASPPTTTLVSRPGLPGAAQANGDSHEPSISADGRFVSFHSSATNLIAGDTNGAADAFVHDTQEGTTTLVSRPTGSATEQANGGSTRPSIASGGGFVAFPSGASNLVEVGVSMLVP